MIDRTPSAGSLAESRSIKVGVTVTVRGPPGARLPPPQWPGRRGRLRVKATRSSARPGPGQRSWRTLNSLRRRRRSRWKRTALPPQPPRPGASPQGARHVGGSLLGRTPMALGRRWSAYGRTPMALGVPMALGAPIRRRSLRRSVVTGCPSACGGIGRAPRPQLSPSGSHRPGEAMESLAMRP